MKKSILMAFVILSLTLFVQAQSNPDGFTEGSQIYSEGFDSAGTLSTNFASQTTGQTTIEVIDYTGKKVWGGQGDSDLVYGCEDLSGTTFTDFDIPVAPNTGDSSKNALRMIANFTGSADDGAVANLYTNDIFDGDYRVKVDIFMRINGPADGGGSGSTERCTVGINHSGTKVNNYLQSDTTIYPIDTDGYFYTMNGERGSGFNDYCLFEGTSGEDPFVWARDVNPCGEIDTENPDQYVGAGIGDGDENAILNLLPYGVDKWRYRGAPGDSWVTLIIDFYKYYGIQKVTLYLDNNDGTVAELTTYSDTDATYESGKILMGYMDDYSSENDAEDSFVLFDNLEVFQLDPPPPPLSADSVWSLYE